MLGPQLTLGGGFGRRISARNTRRIGCHGNQPRLTPNSNAERFPTSDDTIQYKKSDSHACSVSP